MYLPHFLYRATGTYLGARYKHRTTSKGAIRFPSQQSQVCVKSRFREPIRSPITPPTSPPAHHLAIADAIIGTYPFSSRRHAASPSAVLPPTRPVPVEPLYRHPGPRATVARMGASPSPSPTRISVTEDVNVGPRPRYGNMRNPRNVATDISREE
ncbi:hypothetical protein DL769_004741 [Monosporascus sp. CRB-8-3]|nr:hypothetical protein DL769_004741 [Monosporascus sp. CRB-8-3]